MLKLLPVLAVTIWISGCSTFESDWERGLAEPKDAAASLRGAWEGTWRSDANGHHGGLRAIVTEAAEGSIARYHATYGCCFTFEYSVPLRVEVRHGTAIFRGEADLGWLAGGLYRYEGTVEGDRFSSTYRSEADHGVFTMRRVIGH